MTTLQLETHRHIWQEKPVLRSIYHDYYNRMIAHIRPGETLEIGGGSGNLKSYLKNVISTDIINTPWLDTACDAQRLPFSNNAFDNIVGMDVLHHLEYPIQFFKEARRVLNLGGRIILLEPAITIMSWFFYHFFHPEPVIWKVDPFEEAPPNPNRKPFDANQAIPELIFGKYLDSFNRHFPEFCLINKQYMSLWCYPFSGGFRPWSLIPSSFVKQLLTFERFVEKHLGKWMGFRLLVIIEKRMNDG